MVGDAVQATVRGIMRGLGRQRLVLLLNILAFWILAIPSGALLTFVGNSGVAGIWWGYVIGIYSAGFLGMLLLKCRISWDEEAKNATKRLLTLSTLRSNPSSSQVEEVVNEEVIHNNIASDIHRRNRKSSVERHYANLIQLTLE